MRDIRFRAYINNLEGLNKSYFEKVGRMFDVEIINLENKEVEIRCPSALNFTFEDIDLMQFTGLYDIDGKEVWEGDIVKEDDFIGTVTFWDGEFKPIDENNNYCPIYPSGDLTVIGNIHQNPELIK